MKRPLAFSHDFLAEVLDDQSVALDATMGNGNDTVFLAKRSQKVYAFDIQEKALKKTSHRLVEQGLDNAELILDGHENLDQYVAEPLRAAMFNLGYLPSADKAIMTKPQTTIQAIQKVLERLEVGGRLAIMVYPGHAGGDVEKDSVLEFVSHLDQKLVTVMLYQAINQINNPPLLIMLEKHSSISFSDEILL